MQGAKAVQPFPELNLENPHEVFAMMEFEQPERGEAQLVSIARYLRGSKRLRIPESWRPYIPELL